MVATKVKRARGALQAEGTRRAKALGPGKNPRPPWAGLLVSARPQFTHLQDGDGATRGAQK